LDTERSGIAIQGTDAAWERATMGNTKFVEALVAEGGGVAGDSVGDSGVDQGRDFGDEDEGRRLCRRIRILQSGTWPFGRLRLSKFDPPPPKMACGGRFVGTTRRTSSDLRRARRPQSL
jgi:hypothetical protein